jgi:two-component system LytT family response regulator
VSPSDLVETVNRIKNCLQTPNELDSVQILKKLLAKSERKTIALHHNKQTEFININDIEYVKADGSYSLFYLVDGRVLTNSRNIKYFEENTVGAENFIRVHKSFVANKKHIVSIAKTNGNYIVMKSGAKLDISVSYRMILEAVMEDIE